MGMAAVPITTRALGKARRALLPGRAYRPIPFGAFRGIVAATDLTAPFYTWSGLYEYEIQRYFKRFAPKGGRVYDIGGADGLLALMFAKLTSEPVSTFEGDPARLPIIREHMARNRELAELVTVVPEWVGENALRIDDYAQRDYQPPTLLKIDVEGAEHDVLKSAHRTLTARPHLIVEVHGRDQERLCGDLMVEYGYEPSVVPLRRRLRETTGRTGANFDINHWLVAEGSPLVRTGTSARKRVRHR